MRFIEVLERLMAHALEHESTDAADAIDRVIRRAARLYVATAAMQGMLAGGICGGRSWISIAQDSRAAAAALLSELDKDPAA